MTLKKLDKLSLPRDIVDRLECSARYMELDNPFDILREALDLWDDKQTKQNEQFLEYGLSPL